MSTLSRRQFIVSGGFAATFADGKAHEDLALIQLTDTHVSVRSLVSERLGYNESPLPYTFVVHTDEVVHGRETPDDLDLARELLRFDKPAWYVPGNHDLGYSHTAKYRPLSRIGSGPPVGRFNQ